jgi:hypothetical protein
MASEVTRSEFQHLADRVSVLEGEVEGEKVVSRYILEQTRRNGDDLAILKSRMDHFESELREVREEGHQTREELRQLRRELPGIIAETMREVLSERDGE